MGEVHQGEKGSHLTTVSSKKKGRGREKRGMGRRRRR